VGLPVVLLEFAERPLLQDLKGLFPQNPAHGDGLGVVVWVCAEGNRLYSRARSSRKPEEEKFPGRSRKI
jgi:hypothetical protein